MRAKTGAIILLSLLLAFIFTLILNRPTNRVVWQSCQPENVNYAANDPYCLSVVEGSIDWNKSPLGSTRRYSIFIGRGTEAPGYGHYIDHSFHPGYEQIDTHIAKSAVVWSNDGLTFQESSGHRLHVPKEMFIGGR